MPLQSQQQVMDGLVGNTRRPGSNLAMRSVRAAARGYRKGIAQPLTAAIEETKESGNDKKDLQRLLRALGPGLVRQMNEAALAESLAGCMDQAAGIGAASATPRRDRGGETKTKERARDQG